MRVLSQGAALWSNRFWMVAKGTGLTRTLAIHVKPGRLPKLEELLKQAIRADGWSGVHHGPAE
jgi:hypothetical protein